MSTKGLDGGALGEAGQIFNRVYFSFGEPSRAVESGAETRRAAANDYVGKRWQK